MARRVGSILLTVLVCRSLAGQPIDFSRDVRPILARNCFLCHGPDASSREAGLRLDERVAAIAPTRGGGPPAVVPGDPGASELVARVTAHAEADRMPPDGRPPLTPAEVEVLRAWIAQGAVYDVHWSWRPIERGEPPAVADPRWGRHPVDRLVFATLERAGLAPAPRAARSTSARRLFLDVTGLPPSPERVEAFVSDDSPEAWTTLVDERLDSPHYGERWARHWLDLVRYAETYGHEFDYPIRHAWQYRDYVIRAFNADVPYDELVTEHIAGDLLDEPRVHPEEGFDESIVGTGFWFLGQGTHGPVDVRGDEAERVANQIEVFAKTFLGLTVSCARCHDHKFDAVSTADFYALAGFLQSSRRQDAYLDPNGRIADATAELERLAEAAVAETTTMGRSPRTERGDALRDERLTADAYPLRPLVEAISQRDETEAPGAPVPADPAPASGNEHDPLTFASFDDPDGFDGWFVTGFAFGRAPAACGEVALGGERLRFAPPGTAFSGRLGGRLQGTLRSPTFEIDSELVEYRLSGRGRVRLIIDGYVLDEFNALLFEGLTFDVATGPGAWVTRRQSVGRYRGHRAHIELIDDTDGAIAVDEIRFSDRASETTTAWPVEADRDPETQLREIADNALKRWRAGTATPRDVSVLDWLLAHGLLEPADQAERERLRQIVAAARGVNERVPEPMRAVAIADGTPEDEHVFVRGSHANPGPDVPRRFIDSLAGGDQTPITHGSGRLELARRLLASSNPLPARVVVNRVWLHLFGEGLVPTPDDFGALGTAPTHPELLDWLADWFRDEGQWSIKRLIRLLVTTEAYRMSSVATDSLRADEIDPANRLLHRHRVRRLDGESIRDSILAVSGRLDRTMLGPPVPVHLTPFMTGRGRPGRSGPLDGNGRRSVYLEVRRNFLPSMMTAFDTPVPATTIGRRHRSNVPAQALALLNDPFVLEQAGVWARRTLDDPSRSPAERIDEMHRRAYARPAFAKEIDLAIDFLRTQAAERQASDWRSDEATWTDYAHVLFNAKEFVFVD